jgi:hypothetical protein
MDANFWRLGPQIAATALLFPSVPNASERWQKIRHFLDNQGVFRILLFERYL